MPAVAVNVPLLAPELMVMFPGTLNAPGALLDNPIVAVLVAAFVSVTVHVAPCPAPSVVGKQLNDESCAGAIKLKEDVLDTPLAVAVMTAVWLLVTDATVAVNTAVVSPTGTVTLLGTVAFALLLDRAAENPPIGAAPLSVTVQEEEPAPVKLFGKQFKPVNVTIGGG